MNWWLVGAALMLAWIGGTLINDGDNGLVKWLGLFLVLFCGGLLSFALGIPQTQGYINPDEKACAQYVYMEDGTWKCVPWEEGG